MVFLKIHSSDCAQKLRYKNLFKDIKEGVHKQANPKYTEHKYKNTKYTVHKYVNSFGPLCLKSGRWWKYDRYANIMWYNLWTFQPVHA